MDLSRREFIRGAGVAAVSAALPFALARRAVAAPTAASVTPSYRIKYFGANIQLWCFDKTRRYRRDQIRQLKRWGFNKVRDNQPWRYPAQYNMNHAVTVCDELMAEGIEVTLTTANCNPGLENLVSPTQWQALLNRMNGNVAFARTAVGAIGVGTNITSIKDFFRSQCQYMRGLFPQGVRMEPFNGPEYQQQGIWWSLFDGDFRQFAASIGFNVDPIDGQIPEVNSTLANQYIGFGNELKAIWGTPWLDNSAFAYVNMVNQQPNYYLAPFDQRIWSPIITEYGIIKDANNRSGRFLTMPYDIINSLANAGIQVTTGGKTYNCLELFLHAPIDGRFLQVWQWGDTRMLWNPRQYQQLVQREYTQGVMDDYMGVMMDATMSRNISQVGKTLLAA